MPVLLVALLLCLVLGMSQQQTGKTTFRLLLTDQQAGCAGKTELVASLCKYLSDCALLTKQCDHEGVFLFKYLVNTSLIGAWISFSFMPNA